MRIEKCQLKSVNCMFALHSLVKAKASNIKSIFIFQLLLNTFYFYMFRFPVIICLVFTLLCQYLSFYYNQSIRSYEGEKIFTKRSLKSKTKLKEIPICIKTNISSLLHNDACNSTLLYPNYHHCAQCYPHLYSLLLLS